MSSESAFPYLLSFEEIGSLRLESLNAFQQTKARLPAFLDENSLLSPERLQLLTDICKSLGDER